MRETEGTTPKPKLCANIVSPVFTFFTLITRHAHFECDSIPDFQVGDSLSNADDLAGCFVSLTERLADTRIAVRVMLVVVQVTAAEGGGSDGDLDFVRRGGGYLAADL